MKKTIIFLLSVLTIISVTACTNSKYIEDVSSMNEEQRAKAEELLKNAETMYAEAETGMEKIEAAFEMGFRHMALGRNDRAIPYYEEVLGYDAVHYPALSNLANIHKKAEEYEKALEYEKELLEANPQNFEVVRDMVELYILIDQIKEGKQFVMDFSLTEKGAENQDFIKSQMEYLTEKSK
jgi:tetratricopeptide (TPR) repeat protein